MIDNPLAKSFKIIEEQGVSRAGKSALQWVGPWLILSKGARL